MQWKTVNDEYEISDGTIDYLVDHDWNHCEHDENALLNKLVLVLKKTFFYNAFPYPDEDEIIKKLWDPTLTEYINNTCPESI